MTNKANPALIGGFVIGAAALLVACVLVFASGLFSNAQKNMIFFEGSVNGLNIGALVKLKGVAVGKVTDILVLYDEEHGKLITPVIVEFQPDKIFDLQGNPVDGASREDIQKLIRQGLRAQLQTQSLLTGQLFVEINFRPETPAKLVGGDHAMYPEIPSIPSSKEQIEVTVEKIVGELRKMPLHEAVESVLHTVAALEKIATSPQILSSIANLDQTLQDMQRLIRHIDEKITPISEDMRVSMAQGRSVMEKLNKHSEPVLLDAEKALQAAAAAMNQAQSTLLAVDQATGQNASVDMAMKDIGSAARSLRVLADYLERHPDALLYGKDPKGE